MNTQNILETHSLHFCFQDNTATHLDRVSMQNEDSNYGEVSDDFNVITYLY